jgi:hypothetical protein
VAYSELVAAGCVLGKSDQDIARAVNTIVRRSAEYNERRQKEATAKSGIGAAAARQPVPDSHAAPGGA